MSYQSILVDDAGPVAKVTLNRPDKRNPIAPATCAELVAAFRALGDNPAVKVVILTGAGAAFSAGGDLSAMNPQGFGTARGSGPPSLPDLFTTMHGLGKPIIAMVNGHALAGGMGVVAACDLAVAADHATFGLTEILVGLWPMIISAEIARHLGRKQTLELILTGKRLSATEARDAGLINRVVPAADLEAETMRLATELAHRSPAAMALGLRAFYTAQDLPYEQALDFLQDQLGKVLALEDAAEGIAAFLAKRAPTWKGR